MICPCIKKIQKGMTLIEILIALMLGSFLLAGIYKIFLGSNQSYRIQENLSRMQESSRFAMEFISRDVRMADFRACYSDTTAGGGELFGFNNSGLNNSDVIVMLQKDDLCGTAANPNTFSATAFFIKADTTGQPALYRVTSSGQTIALTIDRPAAPPDLGGINILIGAAGATTAGSATANQALIEGIENMQILYGEDTDGDGSPNYYVDSSLVASMDNVVSVRISLLVVSLDNNLTSQPIAYVFNGTTTTPTTLPAPPNPAGIVDRRLRRVFTSTIRIRNR